MIDVYLERTAPAELEVKEVLIPDADTRFAIDVLNWARWAADQSPDVVSRAAGLPQTEVGERILSAQGLATWRETDFQPTKKDVVYWDIMTNQLQSNLGWHPSSSYKAAGGESFTDSETGRGMVMPIARYDIFCLRGLWLGTHVMAVESVALPKLQTGKVISQRDRYLGKLQVTEVTAEELSQIQVERAEREKQQLKAAIEEERRLDRLE